MRDLHEQGQKFADAGAYFHIGMPSKLRRQWLARMLAEALTLCEERGLTNLYAQVPIELLNKYRDFGF